MVQELTARLQINCGGIHADKMVANPLRFADGRNLVDVGPNAEWTIYYELVSRSLLAAQFDERGVYEGR